MNGENLRTLHIGRTTEFYRTNDGYTNIIITELDTLKYFHTDKFIGSYEFVVYCQLSIDSDEVIFVGSLKDYIIRDVQRGNKYCYDLLVSEEDQQYLESVDKAIVCFPDNRMYFCMDNPTIEVYDQCFYIRQESLSGESTKLIRYLQEKEKKESVISYQDILKKQSEIEDEVQSLDINSIIESYQIKVNRSYITKIGGDDKYYVEYEAKCERYDPYINSILPIYCERLYEDKGWGIDKESREDGERWEKFAADETIRKRKTARIQYNQKDHITILLSRYIMHEDAQRYKKQIDFILLENDIKRAWRLNDMPYLGSNNNNYKNAIISYNNKKRSLALV